MPESLRERVSLLGAYHLLMGDKQNGYHWGVENRPLSDTTVAGAPGGIRTHDHLLRRQPLYPLSYWDTLSPLQEWYPSYEMSVKLLRYAKTNWH